MNNILVVFGGRSAEHDISILTATQVCASLDKIKYNVLPVYIDKNGDWYLLNQLDNIDDFLSCKFTKKNNVFLGYDSKLVYRYSLRSKSLPVNCCVVCLHGINGEDGAIAGLCEMCDVPCVNSGLEGSSVGLNKIFFKSVLSSLNIPAVDYVSLNKNKDEITKDLYDDVRTLLGENLIIKPNKLGSSIGVSKSTCYEEFAKAVYLAFKFDNYVVVEKCLNNFSEYNIAIYENLNGLVVSDIEQPINGGDLLSFNDKYMNDNSLKDQNVFNVYRLFPADVSDEIKESIIEKVTRCYKTMFLKGVVRFDFMLDKNSGELFLNEVNTIPGSYANYLYKLQGISFMEMLDDMIKFAMNEKNNERKLVRYFDSSVLSSYKGSIKK